MPGRDAKRYHRWIRMSDDRRYLRPVSALWGLLRVLAGKMTFREYAGRLSRKLRSW